MSQMTPSEYFICGAFGGICTVLVGHPLDTVKVRLQTMPIPKRGERPLYSGTWDCIQKTIKYGGVGGLYKGMAAPLASVAPIFSISFMGFGVGKQICGPPEGEEFKPIHLFSAGAFSGIFTTIIIAPGERIKCLLQIQEGSSVKHYNGPIDCALKLYKQGGIRSIYKGSAATLMRDIPAAGLYFMSYELVKDYFTAGGKKEVTMLGTIIAGGAAGIANWVVGMPADVLKSRFQTAPEGTYPNGMRDVLKVVLKTDGPLGLYRGIVPVLLRAFPANGACFVGLELCKNFLDVMFHRPINC